MQLIQIKRHAHGGIHSQPFERAHLPLAADSARRGDRQARRFAQLAKPSQICSAHGAFGVNVGAEKLGGILLQLREYILRRQAQLFLPPAHQHRGRRSVSTATMMRLACRSRRARRERKAALTPPSRNAALPTMIFSAPAVQEPLGRAPPCECRRRRARAWSARRHSARTRRALLPLPIGGVQIDHVKQRILAEALEQAEDVVHGQAPLAPVHQLHGAAISAGRCRE